MKFRLILRRPWQPAVLAFGRVSAAALVVAAVVAPLEVVVRVAVVAALPLIPVMIDLVLEVLMMCDREPQEWRDFEGEN